MHNSDKICWLCKPGLVFFYLCIFQLTWLQQSEQQYLFNKREGRKEVPADRAVEVATKIINIGLWKFNWEIMIPPSYFPDSAVSVPVYCVCCARTMTLQLALITSHYIRPTVQQDSRPTCPTNNKDNKDIDSLSLHWRQGPALNNENVPWQHFGKHFQHRAQSILP